MGLQAAALLTAAAGTRTSGFSKVVGVAILVLGAYGLWSAVKKLKGTVTRSAADAYARAAAAGGAAGAAATNTVGITLAFAADGAIQATDASGQPVPVRVTSAVPVYAERVLGPDSAELDGEPGAAELSAGDGDGASSDGGLGALGRGGLALPGGDGRDGRAVRMSAPGRLRR